MKQIKNNKILIIIIGIVIVIILYLLLFENIFANLYVQKENEMIKKAKDYVIANNIVTNKEIYFDVSKLNIDLSSDCAITSGVFYDGNNYKAYLSCKDYKSNIIKENNNVQKTIKLNGEEVIVLAKGVNYSEPGYISSEEVTIVGDVKDDEGIYQILYNTKNSNSIAIRKVVVIDSPILKGLYPSIFLNGEENIYLIQNNNYQELGANANDVIDGDITSKIVIEKDINSQVIGEYVVNYTITNSRGYSNTVKRIVNVIDPNGDLDIRYTITPDTLTNQNVEITLKIASDYAKIIYPDKTEGKSLTYQVDKNGSYEFIIYDKYNREVKKTIVIDNIDKELPKGSCKAILYYNKTDINVTIDNNKTISSYAYIIDGKTLNTSANNTYTTDKVKPESIMVKVIDNAKNESSFTCQKENKLTRQIITDSKGKNCLEGMVCYVQYDYGNARSYPFCSMANNANSCGGIGRNGCSITSASNAIANMGVKSKTGVIHNPYTVWDELYPINKKTGQCGGGCSGWSRIRDSIVNAGLTAPRSVEGLNKNTLSKIIDNLKRGYPVIIYGKGKPFSSGTAHYMTLLAVNDSGQVFLSDSANSSGTNKATYNGKKYYVDTWINPSDLITGNVTEFLLVGPMGMYEGK